MSLPEKVVAIFLPGIMRRPRRGRPHRFR